MTLVQSKKLSQRIADNAQWEDCQLLRYGAIHGTCIHVEFDDEDECVLLIYGTNIRIRYLNCSMKYNSLDVFS